MHTRLRTTFHSRTRALWLCAILCLAATSALAQTPTTWTIERFGWDGQLEVKGAEVHLTNLHGDIRVRDANSQAIEISAMIQVDSRDSHKAEIEIENDTEGLKVNVHYVPKDEDVSKDEEATASLPEDLIRRVDLVLFLPTGSPLYAETDHGLLEAKGLLSEIEGQTQFGDVRFSTTGPVRIQTLHGKITGVFTTTDWDSPSTLTSLTADIRAELPKDANVAVEATTTGTITTDFSVDIEKMGHGFRKEAHAVIGAGGHSLILETEKGALTLAESPF